MIETVTVTGSTNADLIGRLGSGESLADGYWLRARRQSGGKGRGGRAWVSPEGNIYASTIVNLRDTDPAAHTLSMVAGLAVWRMVTDRLKVQNRAKVLLKWPNDVLVSGAKIAGILLERHGSVIVTGIGINLSHAPDIADRKTTSLADENSEMDANPDQAMLDLAACFSDELAIWRDEGTRSLFARWQAAAHPVGTQISVHESDGAIVAGTFAGLADDGGLRLCLANGAVRTIHAGDVSLIAEG
ncbi:biotin--[acetyl-CoA-carboxylase] ligase [Erythrobacter insulae]|uniref:biotin--[biotin carboxyl-carrier protein] ligase n=1 Tax=Erythrobacter insulae TaxID=2584124 RepID=A0A547PEH4_9SPHN|nr:biotin--[acetyl-CoA-carboxylase] ligase [Erythrobacter insulae]TRD12552.1 biotin--[acetyl-CoA-carboxylase] ligase [Erythrobacter insulae]